MFRISLDANHLEAPVERVTGWDVPYPLYAREKGFLPDAERIFTALKTTLSAEA